MSEKGGYYSSDDLEYKFTNYDVTTGDVLQVFIDYDSNNITIKKVGTVKEDHLNYKDI